MSGTNRNSVAVMLLGVTLAEAGRLQASLEEGGLSVYDLTLASSWTEARRQLKVGNFSVLLVEEGVPGGRGQKAFVRALTGFPKMRIIVLTRDPAAWPKPGMARLGSREYAVRGCWDMPGVAQAIRYAVTRKRTEEELRAGRDELAVRMAERITELETMVDRLKREAGRRREVKEVLEAFEEHYRALFESAPLGIAIADYGGTVLAVNRRMCELGRMTAEEWRGTHAADYYADPEERPRLVLEVRRKGQVEEREVVLRRKDGSTFPAILHMKELQVGGRRLVMTIVRDITAQKATERRVAGVRDLLELFATKETRREYAEAVVRLLREWCGCQCAGIRLPDESGGMPYVAQTGYSKQFLRRETCLCSTNQDCPCFRVLRGQPAAGDVQFTGSKGSFFCNRTAHCAQGLWATRAGRAQAACLMVGYNSLAHAPIRYRRRLLGTIHLADRREGRFPAETVDFIETVAPLVGEALHRFQVEAAHRQSEARFRTMFEGHAAAMLLVDPKTGALVDANPAAATFYGYPRERLRHMYIADLNVLPESVLVEARNRAVRRKQNYFLFPHRLAGGEIRTVEVHSSPIEVGGCKLLFSIIHDVTERRLQEREVLDVGEKERQRLGRDLHDSLGSKLTGVALISKALAHKLGAYFMLEAKLAEEVVQRVNELIRETRVIAHGLCPVELGVSGLAGGLVEFAAETRVRAGIACQVEMDEEVKIQDAFLATHLFRIAQEAVNNAIRHGHAREIRIQLRQTDRDCWLQVADDGVGMREDAESKPGLGLRTMKHRASVIGAILTIAPGEERGTVVTCRWPRREEREEQA